MKIIYENHYLLKLIKNHYLFFTNFFENFESFLFWNFVVFFQYFEYLFLNFFNNCSKYFQNFGSNLFKITIKIL